MKHVKPIVIGQYHDACVRYICYPIVTMYLESYNLLNVNPFLDTLGKTKTEKSDDGAKNN